MKTKWKKIPNIPSNFKASNTGKIRKEVVGGGHVEVNQYLSGGTYVVSIEGKQYKVHRLIAQTFVANPKGHRYVKHKDGNKLNNNVDNLEWINTKEYDYVQYTRRLKNHKLIKCVETGDVFSSLTSVDFYLNIPREAVRNALYTGDVCFGYHFEFVDVEGNVDNMKYLSYKDVIELSKTLKKPSELKKHFK